MGKISLILPLYNEVAILQEVLDKYIADLKSIGAPYEIIAVNDGCTDGSDKILIKAARMNRALRIIHLDGRWGKQSAITAGMEAADKESEIIILADIDILNPVGILKRIVGEYKKGASIVCARRENFGYSNVKSRASTRIVKIGSRLFGVDGNYNGKVDIALYSRAVADVICALPERNMFLRAMNNWIGWQVKYVDYASGYNKIEERDKTNQATTRHRENNRNKQQVRRDRAREHTPSVDLAWTFAIAALILFGFGIALAVGAVPIAGLFWTHVIAWLGFATCLLISLACLARAVLIKRVGVLHTRNTEKIYVVKNIVN